MQKRQEDLQRSGGYRTLLNPLAFRAPSRAAELVIRSARGPRRGGQASDRYRRRGVANETGPAGTFGLHESRLPTLSDGGSAQVDQKRQDILQRFVGLLVNKLEGTSMSKHATATNMNSQPGFRQALRDARLSTVIAFLRLFPDTFEVGSRVRLTPLFFY